MVSLTKRILTAIAAVITITAMTATMYTTIHADEPVADVYYDNEGFINRNILILLYHDLSEGELKPTDDQAYCTTDIKFEKDIIDLLGAGYESLSLEHYASGDYDQGKKYFIITFDDGYLSNYTLAYPLLCKHNVYADIFICTENTTLPNHFGYAQAREMENSGLVKIYSHMTKHIDCTSMDLDSFIRETERAYRYIDKRISNDRLAMFAYPYSLCSRDNIKTLYESGTVLQFVQVPPDDLYEFDYAGYGLRMRINVEHSTDMAALTAAYSGKADISLEDELIGEVELIESVPVNDVFDFTIDDEE